MIHVPSERGFPFIPDRMDQTILCLLMSSVREGRVENHLSPVQNVRPVFMTAVRIRNFRRLTAAAASFDAITEHFRTWNPQVSAYVVIVGTPAGVEGGAQTSSAIAEAQGTEESAQPSLLQKMKTYFTTQRVVVLFYQTGSQLWAVKSQPRRAVTFRHGADLHSVLYQHEIQSAIMRATNKYAGVLGSIFAPPFARRQLNSACTSNVLPTDAW